MNARVYFAMFRHHYGQGSSVADAVKNARRCGARGRDYVVFLLPEGAWNPQVDMMGRIWWDGPADDAVCVKASGSAAGRIAVYPDAGVRS